MALTLRAATVEDVELLARMNQQLIWDEGHRNPMNLGELTARMRSFLAGGWGADLILDGDRSIGYALYQFRRDDFDPALPVVYVRQYFIRREYRHKGCGKAAFVLLRARRFGPRTRVVIEVLAANHAGKRFWDTLGFTDYAVTMELAPQG